MMRRVARIKKKRKRRSAIISMRPLRPPPSLCVSMCACVITMMDGSEPGLLFRFIQGAGPSDYSRERERPAPSIVRCTGTASERI